MKYCSTCGVELPAGAQFCPSCGAAQVVPPPLTAPTPPASAPAAVPTSPPPPARRKSSAGCAAIGVLVVIGLMIACSNLYSGTPDTQSASLGQGHAREKHHANARVRGADAHPGCEGARYFSNKATNYENAGAHQAAYDAAVAGLNRVEACSDDAGYYDAEKGYLLGSKALAEHHLASGNSRDDLNQAITLLASCQTEPGMYGTPGGAHCESEEETLISYKTNWELESY